MKRKDEETPVEFFAQKSKRLHESQQIRDQLIAKETTEFLGNYYVCRAQMARYLYDDENAYPSGVYFSIIHNGVATREARQWLINTLDIYYVKPLTGTTSLLVWHYDWPPTNFNLYGYIPPIRKAILTEFLDVIENTESI